MTKYTCDIAGIPTPFRVYVNSQTNNLFVASILGLPDKRITRTYGNDTMTDAGSMIYVSKADTTADGAIKLLMEWVAANLGAPGPLVPVAE